MKRLMMILMAAALVALPTMAQSFGSSRSVENDQQAAQNYTTTQPFRSPSAMQSTGSAYSANPTLNTDGTAYNPADVNGSNNNPRQPRRSFGDNQDGGTTTDPSSPIGDAVWPLMLMALAYLGVRVFFRRKRAE